MFLEQPHESAVLNLSLKGRTMNMKAIIEAAHALNDYATLTIDRKVLDTWQRNPLQALANIIGLSAEDAATVAEVAPECLQSAPPAGLKLAEFERATGRLAGALLARLVQPDATAKELSFALGDAWCIAEDFRFERVDAEKAAKASARKAARITAKIAALQASVTVGAL